MRLKALTLYNFSTTKKPIIIFYFFFMLGTILSSVLVSISTSMVMGIRDVNSQGVSQDWSSSIIAFAIFMVISSLISSQKETQFLITRSVSRKEIIAANALFMLPLAAIMTALQVIGILIDGAIRKLLGGEVVFRGIRLDIQSMQAPNMTNIFVFFAVSFSILVCAAAISYLLGSCMARWKMATVGVLAIGGMAFIASFSIPGFFNLFADALKFMFVDDNNGLMIAVKQLALAAVVMLIALPVVRGITAAKQTQ